MSTRYAGLRVILLAALALAPSRALASPTTRPRDGQPAVAAPLPRVWCTIVRTPDDEADPQPFVVRVSRSGETALPLAVWVHLGGTMTPGLDYVAPPKVFVIPEGRAGADLLIRIIDDDLAEGIETFEINVSLSPPAAAAPTTAPATR